MMSLQLSKLVVNDIIALACSTSELYLSCGLFILAQQDSQLLLQFREMFLAS